MAKSKRDRRVTLLPLVYQKLEARAAAEDCSVSDLVNTILLSTLPPVLQPQPQTTSGAPAATNAAPDKPEIYTQNFDTW
ncbi:MAG: hypothetical protein AAGH78_01280 [Cyanobacteria bacterium P01_H01_bin.58]